jgi:hypothetical protein
MRIENRVLCLTADAQTRTVSWLEIVAEELASSLESDAFPLRWSVVAQRPEGLVLEVTVLRLDAEPDLAQRLQTGAIRKPRRKSFPASPFCVVQVVPTGVRCEFGGYAGDACPATNLLAAAADFVVTHPNAVNGSDLNEMGKNVLYVEGRALDDFLLGHLGLHRVASNRIGTFVDPTGRDTLETVLLALNAARAVGGIACGSHTLLDQELGVEIAWTESGCAVGTVRNPQALCDGVEKLLATGVDAVGGVSVIHGVTKEMHQKHARGEIPNPSGGVEAIITHLVSALYRIPTAHAPLPYYQSLKGTDLENPRVAAELISTPHYFSVLKGLSRAPRLVEIFSLDGTAPHLLTLNHVGAIVVPASCLGGIPALAAEFSDIPLIAVRENETILDVTNRGMRMRNVVEVDSYLAAAGVVLALKEGISLESLRRPLAPLPVAGKG